MNENMRTDNGEFTNKLNEVLGTNYIATILLDMDDVLADFGTLLLELYNEKYNDSLKTSDMISWDMTPYVKPECGLDIYELMKTPGFFSRLKPTPYSQEVVNRLIENNYNVMIVSDSPMGHSFADYELDNECISNPADDKRAWLLKHFSAIPLSNVFFGSQKFFIRGDVLVDDKPDTYEKFKKFGFSCVLMNQAYNAHIKTNNRVHNMLEVEKVIYDMFENAAS